MSGWVWANSSPSIWVIRGSVRMRNSRGRRAPRVRLRAVTRSLNLIESFFGKMAKTLLRGIRVASADELKARIELYLKEVNETPVVFRWKYKLETLSVV